MQITWHHQRPSLCFKAGWKGMDVAILRAIGLLVLLQAQPALAGQTGGFIPSSQLLTWCKSKDGVEMMTCFGYVSAIAEATGNTAVKWPKGNVAIPGGASPDTQIAKVVAYIEAMPREKLSSPASDAVYEALVAAWPRKPIGPAPAP